MSNAKIAEKISKIIAKADATAHPEEAESFMAMAHRLLEEHGMSLQELGTLNVNDPLGVYDSVHKTTANTTWRTVAAAELARYYGCTLVVYADGVEKRWELVGRQNAVTTFELMWPFVMRQIMAAAVQLKKDGAYRDVKPARTAVSHSLALRINRLVTARTPSQATGDTSNALVPVNEIEELLNSMNLRHAKRKVKDNARDAAAGISIDRQAAQQKQKQLSTT
jgi:hypothetical protein